MCFLCVTFWLKNLQKWFFICFLLFGFCIPSIILADEGSAPYKIGVGDMSTTETSNEQAVRMQNTGSNYEIIVHDKKSKVLGKQKKIGVITL